MAEEQKPSPVDGDLTPISRKEIKPVDSNEWNNSSLTQLYDQLGVLHSRLVMANNLGQPALIKQIQMGIDRLQAVIASKSGEGTGVT